MSPAGSKKTHKPLVILFTCFFLSGFTGLLYQTVWIRLALARFGVNTEVVAIVLSVFMLGLVLGTFLGGRWAERLEARFRLRGLELYAGAEIAIAVGGLSVATLFGVGRDVLLSMGAAGSLRYTLLSAFFVSLSLLPFCVAMGATFPAGLAFVKRLAGSKPYGRPQGRFEERGYGFSFLYLANVAGALLGVLLTSFILLELVGFKRTLALGVLLNLIVAALALRVTSRMARSEAVDLKGAAGAAAPRRVDAIGRAGDPENRSRLMALFLTGFCSMGLEIVWTRIYPPFVGTFVYSFAGILATYLVATTVGSLLYRRGILPRGTTASPFRWWAPLCAASMLPLLSASVKVEIPGPLRIIIGLAPFCAILGIVTPWILDKQGGHQPTRVGNAYGLNLLGCVLGPLVTGFVLIPALGTKIASVILVTPLFVFGFLWPAARQRGRRFIAQAAAVALACLMLLLTRTFEEQFPSEQVRYDHTATVVASGDGQDKRLYVNGVGMTVLTPITKMMVHFPLAHVKRQADGKPDGLVVCMGMGTSLRSLASWGGRATAVELVPSVPKFFSYYFSDASELLRQAGDSIRIEVDDGRRFLDRTSRTFHLITVDPPPPVEAAGSSLLYSKEFYQSAVKRMEPDGILQAWLPGGDRETLAAVTRSILESFAEVRAFRSMEGWGIHYLASQSPIPRLSAEDLLARMPAAAVRDMTEWSQAEPIRYIETMLRGEIDPHALLLPRGSAGGIALTDDRPVNEFFFVRRYLRIGRTPL